MPTALNISEATTLGLHGMALLAEGRERRLSVGEMARRLRVSEAHLAKVMQRLAHAGLVRSLRGPRGGFRLARAREAITLLQIYEAIEGPLRESSCLLEVANCDRTECILGGLVETVNRQVRDHLEGTRLCDVAGERQPAEAAQPEGGAVPRTGL